MNYDDEILKNIDVENALYVSLKNTKDYCYENNSIFYKGKEVINKINNKNLIGDHNKINLVLIFYAL